MLLLEPREIIPRYQYPHELTDEQRQLLDELRRGLLTVNEARLKFYPPREPTQLELNH